MDSSQPPGMVFNAATVVQIGIFMSLQSTKEHLINLLDDPDNKVIALSGKWGTGKSHLWGQVKDASQDANIKGALYVSLFGLSGIEQIKMKLIQSAVPYADTYAGAWNGAKQAVASSIKVLEGFHKSFSALNGLGLMVAPAMLGKKVIVIDDIERKHENLSIDEVLGFIDEFTQQHKTRFVLILNSDQLAKKEVWDTLREKVIDQEVRLDTSPSDAFDIAIGLTPSLHAARIREAVLACGLTNIRIVRKVIKTVNRILGDRLALTDAVLSRMIPSTTLLAAIHYKGIEDGPDFEFVISQGTPNDWSYFADNEQMEDGENKRKSKWKLLLVALNISSCDGFEMLVIEFLKSGLYDVGDLSKIIDIYVSETDTMNALHEAKKLIELLLWDHRLSETELLQKVQNFAPKANLLDADSITSLCNEVSELPGGATVVDGMLFDWIEMFKTKNFVDFNEDNPFGRLVHPLIQDVFDTIKSQVQANTTLLEACSYISSNGGWGPRQELAMKRATVADFDSLIRTVNTPELQIFMRKMLGLTLQRSDNVQFFGTAMDHFVEACKLIAQDPQSGRLGDLIKFLFMNSHLISLIEPPTVAA